MPSISTKRTTRENWSIFCNRDITKITSSNNTNGSPTNFAGISVHTCVLLHRNPNSAHVSENASETQIDATMTFTVLNVSIEQNRISGIEIQYTLTGIKLLFKIGKGGSLACEGGSGTLPSLRPSLKLGQHLQNGGKVSVNTMARFRC